MIGHEPVVQFFKRPITQSHVFRNQFLLVCARGVQYGWVLEQHELYVELKPGMPEIHAPMDGHGEKLILGNCASSQIISDA